MALAKAEERAGMTSAAGRGKRAGFPGRGAPGAWLSLFALVS
jgi:hypothetical protein